MADEILKKRKEYLESIFKQKKALIEKELQEIDKIYKELVGLNSKLEQLEKNK